MSDELKPTPSVDDAEVLARAKFYQRAANTPDAIWPVGETPPHVRAILDLARERGLLESGGD